MRKIQIGSIGGTTNEYKSERYELEHNIISHIIVSYDECGVRCIRFCYVNDGALAMSKSYGPPPNPCYGYSTRIVRLKHESEFVTGLSGETCDGFVTSLTFHTNQRTHQAVHLTFDSKDKVPRKIELHSGVFERRELGGFFVTYCSHKLISIGLYVMIVLPVVETIKEEKVSTDKP